jgi:hypothetical protein
MKLLIIMNCLISMVDLGLTCHIFMALFKFHIKSKMTPEVKTQLPMRI